jgi:hypothetical protein
MDITNAGQNLRASEDQSADIRQDVTVFLNENCRTGASIASLWETLKKPKHENILELNNYVPLLPPIWQPEPRDDGGRWLERYKLLQIAACLFDKRQAETDHVILPSTDRTEQDNRERSPIDSISSVSKMEGIEMEEPTKMNPSTLGETEDMGVNGTELR